MFSDWGHYAIYVWDTCQVVEEGRSLKAYKHANKDAVEAVDNHEPLKGAKDDYNKKVSDEWTRARLAKTKGVHYPTEEEIDQLDGSWKFKGSTFHGNGAYWPMHAKRIATIYMKNPQKHFSSLVTKLIAAMHSNNGSYNGHGESGPTFNDILFNIDRRATDLARELCDAKID